MTKILHSALEELLKQEPKIQNAAAQAIFKVIRTSFPTTRPIGLADGEVRVLDSFFDPLPDEELALWNGEGPDVNELSA